MSEREHRNRQSHSEVSLTAKPAQVPPDFFPAHDESDNEYNAEHQTSNIGKIAENTISKTIHTGLKIGEAKEKLVISKDNKKLRTDRKSRNFHGEKRNNRFQVDRLSTLDESDIDNESTENSNTEDNETSESNSTIIEKAEGIKDELQEPDSNTKANTQSKKVIQRKMRERMREQRQRTFTGERQDSKNDYYYNDGFTDYEDYGNHSNDDYNDYADTPPNKLTTDTIVNMDSSQNEDDTNKDKIKILANRTDERAKPFQTDNSNKPVKLNINAKTQGLKQEKSEVKLKTDKKDSLDLTPSSGEDKTDKKKHKLRRKQHNKLVNKKYNLKKTRLANTFAVSKLIINSGEDKDSQSPIYTAQGNGNTTYAEQEQENLNKNLTDLASTSLKSVIADFEAFEAKLSAKDDVKALQKKFNKKRQYNSQRIKKKAEKASEHIRDNIKRTNEIIAVQGEKLEKLNHDKNIPTTQALNGSADGKSDITDYKLNSKENGNSLNKRDNNESRTSLTRRKKDKRSNPGMNGKNGEDTNSINGEKNKSAKIHAKRRGKNSLDTLTSDKHAKSNLIKNNPAETMQSVNSRLKHDKTPYNRKGNTTATASEKLKFSRKNASRHEHREEKLLLNKDNGKSRANANAFSVSIKSEEQQKSLQKKTNKKSIYKNAIKIHRNQSENPLRFGKGVGKATAKQTLEAAKFLLRLMIKKVIALILFIISKITIVATLIMIPIIVIAVIGIVFLGTAGTMLLASYLADDETLSQVSVYYSDKERDLTNSLTEIAVKSTYDVDEVNYILVDNIGHNPHYLLSYLTAKYQNFTFDQVQTELDTIFSLQYTKTETVREVDVPILDADGEPTGEFETRKIADVTLTNNGFYDILYERLTDSEREHFLLLVETTGNRQYGGYPMSWDWLINITENFNNLNNGVEAEVPSNTPVYGTISGEITATSADSVIIQGAIGNDTIIITFSRLNNVAVNVGDKVKMTTIVGYTSDRIFIQIQRNGAYVNPVLFLGSQRQDLVYGTNIPPLTQSEFNTLRDFASAALGTPYVFSGSGPPPRGIDCSGFIWWAYNGSGIKSWGRTTAQGQFNQCDPITLADARPGDLIFFQGTYDTGDSRVVTHVGIYLGNGQMQHSGTPNQITSINSAYWQKHFYSFGRISRNN